LVETALLFAFKSQDAKEKQRIIAKMAAAEIT